MPPFNSLPCPLTPEAVIGAGSISVECMVATVLERKKPVVNALMHSEANWPSWPNRYSVASMDFFLSW